MSRRRQLSEDERALWAGVTRSVAPLRRRPKPAHATIAVESEPTAVPPAARVAPTSKPSPSKPSSSKPSPPKPAAPAPPLAPLGRRQKQRVARGRDAIDARIDLHGLTLGEAHGALMRFLRRAQADGGKIALVVTGKGAGKETASGGARGALRREVPMWLRLPEFRPYVVGFEGAHIGHGGEGALYVRLRRAR